MSVSAAVQIAILYVAVYSILKRAKGSRFGQALTGVGILAAALFAFSYFFKFDVLTRIVLFILAYLAVSTVVIFQPEIRRILMAIGAFGFLEKRKYHADGTPDAEFVAKTLLSLAHTRTGALVAFERGISLGSIEETGVKLDAVFSAELMRSIFTPPLPLHDGGLIVRRGRAPPGGGGAFRRDGRARFRRVRRDRRHFGGAQRQNRPLRFGRRRGYLTACKMDF